MSAGCSGSVWGAGGGGAPKRQLGVDSTTRSHRRSSLRGHFRTGGCSDSVPRCRVHSTVDPFGADSQIFKAPENVAPLEVPTKIPSFCASSCDSRIASAPLIGTIWCISFIETASSVSLGMKSGAQPCITCGRKFGWLAEGEPSATRGYGMPLLSIGRLSGSQTMIFVFGLFSASTRATPFNVPPVPNPVTQ